jgi:CRP/FNR family transcriptional regulator, cyclic AMP receptor protein
LNEKLLSIARAVEVRRGERLLRQGETARGAFVLRSGEVEALVALPGGGTLSVARRAAGDMLGETALIERGTCMASVVARTDVAAWLIERDDFRALVAGRDPAAFALQRAVTGVLLAKLRAATARLIEHPAAEDRPAAQPRTHGRREPGFEWRRFLPAVPFFEGFAPEDLAALVDGCPVFELERGGALYSAGESGHAAYLVVRGAVEVVFPAGELERRITVAGPGELVGYRAVLERAVHFTSARVRESACVIELGAVQFLRHYEGASATTVRLQRAIHRSLLQALTRTNAQLARLICHARLSAARSAAEELEQALHSQIVLAYN